jgi:hypothetical protein
MKKALVLGAALAVLGGGPGFSLDFGGVLSQTVELGKTGSGGDGAASRYGARMIPWASAPLPNDMFLYLSAFFTGEYESDRGWTLVPEPDRFEITWRPRPNIFLEAGRFEYADPLGIVASGLFDGAELSLGLGQSRLSLGAFYTGLLYKKTANIIMSGGDALDYGDEDRYWAPGRAFFSARYTLPALISWKDTLSAGIIGQFDLRDGAGLHTQYLMAQYLISPLDRLMVNAGGVLGFAEGEGAGLAISYALSLEGGWYPPVPVEGELSLRLRYASGLPDRGDTLGPFRPITGASQSEFLDAPLSGLLAASAILNLRPLEECFLTQETKLLGRTDLAALSSEGLDPGSGSRLLGLELLIGLAWTPLSDLGLNLAGGVFLPLPGSAFFPDTPAKWKVSLGLTLSF